jgi:phospholipid/cholesterol/gamma-HCH transport system substrate-binding protein
LKISKEVKLGVFVVIALSMLVYGINLLKGVNIFSHQRIYYAIYDDVDGLVNSNPVTFNGYKVGLVKDIELLIKEDNDIKIMVTFIISEKKLNIPKDSKARVISSDFLGSKAIEIELGSSNELALSESFLDGETAEGIKEMFDKQIAPLKEKTEDLISSIETVITQIKTIIDDEDDTNPNSVVSQIRSTLSDLQTSTANIKNITGDPKIKGSISNLNSITENFDQKKGQINEIIDNFYTITATLNDSTLNELNQTLETLSSISKKIENGEGSMGKFMNNDSLYNELTNASNSLDALLEDMKHNPKKYVHFSIFGRKQKGLQLNKKEEKKLKEILAQ